MFSLFGFTTYRIISRIYIESIHLLAIDQQEQINFTQNGLISKRESTQGLRMVPSFIRVFKKKRRATDLSFYHYKSLFSINNLPNSFFVHPEIVPSGAKKPLSDLTRLALIISCIE